MSEASGPTAPAIDASRYASDKAALEHYLANYAEHFAPLRERAVRLLELGIDRGGSLQLWADYFPRGVVAGLDVRPVALDDARGGRIRVYQGRQEDVALLDRIAREVAPEGFDVVIDDCSHYGSLARISFWHLFERHLKPGGVYAIEDWGTGYWERWPDGRALRPPRRRRLALRYLLSRLLRRPLPPPLEKRLPSHDYGMVGFVKELVDECGMGDATLPGWGTGAPRPSRFEKMQISHGHVFVWKHVTSRPGR